MEKIFLQVDVFSIDELGTDSFEKAYYEWRRGAEYFWHNENENTLIQFEKLFLVETRGYSYEYDEPMRFRFTEGMSYVREMSGVRLMKYIQNNYYNSIFSRKCYYKGKNKRVSEIQFERDCPLTGFYLDCDILNPIWEFLKKPSNKTFSELIQECLESWNSACKNDYDSSRTREYFEEQCAINNWRFEEDGSKF